MQYSKKVIDSLYELDIVESEYIKDQINFIKQLGLVSIGIFTLFINFLSSRSENFQDYRGIIIISIIISILVPVLFFYQAYILINMSNRKKKSGIYDQMSFLERGEISDAKESIYQIINEVKFQTFVDTEKVSNQEKHNNDIKIQKYVKRAGLILFILQIILINAIIVFYIFQH